MAKHIKTSPKAAYKVVPGITAEEAADKGYVIVESNADGTSPLYGYYENTATGAAMEVLRDKDDREAVPAGGETSVPAVSANKGALINPNDPVVHGQGDQNPHEDGAAPLDSENAGLADVIEGYSPGDPLKAKKK